MLINMAKAKKIFDRNRFYELYSKTNMGNISSICAYIKSCGGVLPPDITRQLFADYQKDKQNGVDIANSVPRTILIFANEGLIAYTTKSMHLYNSNSRYEEYLMRGKFGLINAVDNYDLNKNRAFSSFAHVCIKNEIIKELKESKSISLESLDDSPFYEKSKMSNTIIDTESGEYDCLMAEDVLKDISEEFYIDDGTSTILKHLNDLLSYLDTEEQVMLSMCIGLNNVKQYRYCDIAKLFHVAPRVVSDKINNILRILRVVYNQYNNLLMHNVNSSIAKNKVLSQKEIEKYISDLQNTTPNTTDTQKE